MYSPKCTDIDNWGSFAQLILEASYEATLWAAVIHSIKHKEDPRARVVLLTQVGGGVFGNKAEWIAIAIQKALSKIRNAGVFLDVRIVCYDASSGNYPSEIKNLIKNNQ